IIGASDDDPSGIATYSQAGAQFGFGMLWMALFQYPLMTVIQEMCANSLITFNTAFISVTGLTERSTNGKEGSKNRMRCNSSFDSTSHRVIPPGESANA